MHGDRGPHRANDPERLALPHISKVQADEHGLVTRDAIARRFRRGPGAVAAWTRLPSFPRPVALLNTKKHRPLLYPSGVVTRWVHKHR